MTTAPAIDLHLVDLDVRQASALDRRAMAWLLGLLALVALTIALLALFLRDVERQEEDRRRTADAQWLDQTLLFHFRRLEGDLASVAQKVRSGAIAPATLVRAGALWRADGVVERHGWLPAESQGDVDDWPEFLRALTRHPGQAEAVAAMIDTGRGLQRAAYAGPLPAAGGTGQALWVALPLFEQGRFLGSYVAAVQVERALEVAVPAWFLQDHALTVALAGDERESARRYLAAIHLPGAQWQLQVDLLALPSALAPRAFFGVALACLLGMGVALAFLARDVARRRRIEALAARQRQKLEASARLVAVGEVASTLAHELNQPLGALSSFATGLLNRLRDGRIALGDVTPVVERMAGMADKAGRVIQRVNAFARRQEMTRQPLALGALLHRVVAEVELETPVALQLELPEAELLVLADALLVEHALRNVLINALHWANQGGQARPAVHASLVQRDGMAGIRVEDSGPGVAPEKESTIFDAFASGRPGGMGMGLSICRSILEAHHGRVEVGRSPSLHGAEFILWFPLTS